MRPVKPPAMATWLLEHFQSGPQNDHLTGDLMEAYEQGRSHGWYWKQTVAAILVSFCHEVATHPLLGLRAISAGWATWFLFYYGVGPGILGPLVRRFFLPSGYPFAPSMQIWWIASLFVHAASGWIVARLHRSHRIAMVLLFAASVCIVQLRGLPGVWFEATNTLTNTRFLPYLIFGLELQILWPAAILLGGLWGADPERESVRQGSRAIPLT
jgi:hypothetical protein